MRRRVGKASRLLELVQELKAEVASLREELAEVRRENLILRQEALYGHKSEHSTGRDRSNHLPWLASIRAVYQNQRRRLAHKPSSAKFRAADKALRKTLALMERQAAAELADSRVREPCRKALASLQEHWAGLTRFVDDRRIPLDNNASERAARGPAVGRKNYYGSGALWSGRLAAMLFSLFATVHRCGVNPRLWLASYLGSCAAAGGKAPEEIAEFLPWQMTTRHRDALALAAHRTS
jgi:transposase